MPLSCKLLGHHDKKYLGNKNGYKIYECRRCHKIIRERIYVPGIWGP